MFIVRSSEGRRRIAVEFGVSDSVMPRYGEVLHAAAKWQIRTMLGLAFIFLGSTLALALGIVAWHGRPQVKTIAAATICLSLLDLMVAVFLAWGIS